MRRPEAALSELEVVDQAERCQLLAWSAKAAYYLPEPQVLALLGEQPSGDGGAALEGLQGYVVDRWQCLAPVGFIGELCIGGIEPQDQGHDPGLAASRFIPDPFDGTRRLYRTGALARWRGDGVLELVGAGDAAAQGPTREDAAAVVHEAPRTPLEEVIAGIWLETLGVERIGIHDNFFALGGHSLLATRVMARVRNAFAVDLPLRTLFEAPTVLELAARVSERINEYETVLLAI